MGWSNCFIFCLRNNYKRKKRSNKKRVACQSKTVTFEKIENKSLANEAIQLLETSNYIIKSRIEKSKYMKSQISNHICEEKANEHLEKVIKPYLKEKIPSGKKKKTPEKKKKKKKKKKS